MTGRRYNATNLTERIQELTNQFHSLPYDAHYTARSVFIARERDTLIARLARSQEDADADAMDADLTDRDLGWPSERQLGAMTGIELQSAMWRNRQQQDVDPAYTKLADIYQAEIHRRAEAELQRRAYSRFAGTEIPENALDKALGDTKLVPVFINVNEEGDEYGRGESLVEAMATLLEFPNDSIVVKLRYGSEPTGMIPECGGL
jgi:hypothetical protein